MANKKKLMESFEAYVNNDHELAKQLFREYFIESAQEINADLEESFGGDPEEDLQDEIVAEAFGDEAPGDEDDFVFDDEGSDASEGEVEEYADNEMEDHEEEFHDGEGDVPTADEWADLQDQFDELEALFDELGGDDAGEDFGGEDEFGAEDGEDEVVFGEEEDELNESIEMKAVKDPGMTKETENDPKAKSLVAKGAKSPTGAKPYHITDGKVTGSNVKAEYTDTTKPEVKDQKNVMDSGKGAYTKHAEPNMKSEEAGVDKQSIQKSLRK